MESKSGESLDKKFSPENENNSKISIDTQNVQNKDINSFGSANQKCHSNNSKVDKEESIYSQILRKYHTFQQETGCTNEELFELVLDIETGEIDETEFSDLDEETDYGSHEYWENRYAKKEDTFDWYFEWSEIENKITNLLKNKANDLALNIGCGNSEMSTEMQQTTFKKVVSIDISPSVIHQMAKKYKDNENLYWYEMDCTDMAFKDDLFDFVFDKGTFDAIMCGNNNTQNICDTLEEICRILKPGGCFVEVTFGDPRKRVSIFNARKLEWTMLEPETIKNIDSDTGETKVHYIYIFVKDDEKKKENDD